MKLSVKKEIFIASVCKDMGLYKAQKEHQKKANKLNNKWNVKCQK